MSLLLDALREAEARKSRGEPLPTAHASLDAGPALTLLDESGTPNSTEPERAETPSSQSSDRPSTGKINPIRAARAARETAPGKARRAQRSRNTWPWLIGVGGILVLLSGGIATYEALSRRATPSVTAADQAPTRPTEPLPQIGLSEEAPRVTGGIASLSGPSSTEVKVPREVRPRVGDAKRSPSAARPPRSAQASSRPGSDGDDRLRIRRSSPPLAEAWAALQRGDLAAAESLYRSVLDADPRQVDAEFALAALAHVRGDVNAARAGYRRVLQSVPGHPRAWAGLAELANATEWDELESRLRQLLAERADAAVHFALGNLLARQQRWADAQLEYFAAASLEPRSADYAFNVAVALDHIGKRPAAASWYGRALELFRAGQPARFDAATVLGRLAQLEGTVP